MVVPAPKDLSFAAHPIFLRHLARTRIFRPYQRNDAFGAEGRRRVGDTSLRCFRRESLPPEIAAHMPREFKCEMTFHFTYKTHNLRSVRPNFSATSPTIQSRNHGSVPGCAESSLPPQNGRTAPDITALRHDYRAHSAERQYRPAQTREAAAALSQELNLAPQLRSWIVRVQLLQLLP